MQREWLTTLSQLLDEQIAAMTRIAEALVSERQALTGHDIEALNDASAHKEQVLARFEELEQERSLLCRTVGAGSERNAMEGLIDAQVSPAREGLQAKWRQVMQLGAHCRDANEVNGMIAQCRQRQVLQLLGLMRGGASSGATYGRTGATGIAGAPSRALASA